jgi:hypothetical protein
MAGDDLSSSDKLAFLEVLVHQVFVGLGGRLRPVLARHSSAGRDELGGDLVVVELHALGGLVPDDRLHLEQIDDASLKVSSAPMGITCTEARGWPSGVRLHLVVRP